MSLMSARYIFTSLTRIADFKNNDFSVQPLGRSDWSAGDYIVAVVTEAGDGRLKAELTNGRMMDVMVGDIIIGALGVRHATLEATGDWTKVGDDGYMHLLTGAGLMGKLTSKSIHIPQVIELKYKGHVLVEGHKCGMRDFVLSVAEREFDIPVILMVGTSMSAGKTTASRIITRQLKEAGLRVVGAKLAGAGRYKDILTVKDAGADEVYDFVDVGMPSSIIQADEYRRALKSLLSMLAHTEADVAVIEIGSSPLEPYNGDIAIHEISKQVRCTVLCASDPYAVLGVMTSFDLKPDLATGIATNTIAGIELIERLCEVPAINIIDPEHLPALRSKLEETLGRELFTA